MTALGYNVSRFSVPEDVNSPFSNALMLEMATSPDIERIVVWWLEQVVAQSPSEAMREPAFLRKLVEQEMAQLSALKKAISQAKVLVFTLGNILDHHLHPTIPVPVPLTTRVAPKFFRATSSHDTDVEKRGGVVSALTRIGTVFRLGTYQETKQAIDTMHRALMKTNPNLSIVYTLSPIPIDNVLGVVGVFPGSVEVDCASKSTLRAAIGELIPTWENAYYFPSYEIVRWLGCMRNAPAFGEETSSARLVSESLLTSIYAMFIRRHGNATTAVGGD